MITVKEAAQRWNMSCRNVQDLCRRGRIEGSRRIGRDWMIPKDALRPADARKKLSETSQPLLRRTPFLCMSDLYDSVGQADDCALRIGQAEARELFEAEIAYCRGDIDAVYEHAKRILSQHSGLYATIAGGMLLAKCAMWRGDFELWQQARRHICEAPCNSAADHDVIALSIAAVDSEIRRTDDYPKWFSDGSFEKLHPDAYPVARIYYIKYWLVKAHEVAVGKDQWKGLAGLNLMRALPLAIRPMISMAVANKTVMAEIYLRMLAAVIYLQCGESEEAKEHLDTAIDLCLADGLYTPLVEHRRLLGMFLDERLVLKDKNAAKVVKEMHKQLHSTWVALYNQIHQSAMEISLSARELEVARLAAYGLSNQDIAQRLSVSTHTVRALLNSIRNKTGAVGRAALAEYI